MEDEAVEKKIMEMEDFIARRQEWFAETMHDVAVAASQTSTVSDIWHIEQLCVKARDYMTQIYAAKAVIQTLNDMRE